MKKKIASKTAKKAKPSAKKKPLKGIKIKPKVRTQKAKVRFDDPLNRPVRSGNLALDDDSFGSLKRISLQDSNKGLYQVYAAQTDVTCSCTASGCPNTASDCTSPCVTWGCSFDCNTVGCNTGTDAMAGCTAAVCNGSLDCADTSAYCNTSGGCDTVFAGVGSCGSSPCLSDLCSTGCVTAVCGTSSCDTVGACNSATCPTWDCPTVQGCTDAMCDTTGDCSSTACGAFTDGCTIGSCPTS